MEQRVPTPPFLIPASFLISALAIASKSSIYRQAALIPLCGISIYGIHYTTLGEPAEDYRTACTLTTLAFVALEFLVLTDPLTELRTVAQDKPTISWPFFSRFMWALRLLVSPRLVGWIGEPSNVLPPRSEKKARLSLVIDLSLKLVFELVLLDAIGLIISLTPALSSKGPALDKYPWIWRSVYVAEYGFSQYISLDVTHKVWTLVLLATCLSKPSDYRPLFGAWGQSYTVRKFWGRTWHQMLRQRFKVFGQFVTKQLLGLPRGQLLSYIELYVAFFVSGVIHYWAEYMPLGHWRGHSMHFFLVQAIAIHCEDIFISIAVRFGLRESRMWRYLGYLWVWQWFTWSVPLWMVPLFNVGTMEKLPQLGIIRGAWSLLSKVPTA